MLKKIDSLEDFNRIQTYFIWIYKIKNHLEINRDLNESEMLMISQWKKSYAEELILKACEITLHRDNLIPSAYIRYTNGILRNWGESGVSSLEETEEYKKNFWEENGQAFGFFVGELNKNKVDISRDVQEIVDNSFEKYLGTQTKEQILNNKNATIYEMSINGKDVRLELPNELESKELDEIKYKLFQMVHKNLHIIPGIRTPNINETYDSLKYDYKTGEELTEYVTAVKESMKFVENVKNNILEKKGLLFLGDTGTGKSYLLNCIGNALIAEGLSVAMFSSAVLFETLINYRFGKEKNAYYNILKEMCAIDLLIIDDLGSEITNRATNSCLFEIINERLLNNKPIAISTNLSLKEINYRYGQEILSRIYSYLEIICLYGSDIRIFKKRLER